MRKYDDVVDVRQGGLLQGGLLQGGSQGGSQGGRAGGVALAGRTQQLPPTQFLWHGRLYVVRDVLAKWVETGSWWSAPAAQLVHGMSEGGPGGGPGAQDDEPGTGIEVGEQQVWRVEASAGRASGSGVFDLAHDTSAGVWRLTRALD